MLVVDNASSATCQKTCKQFGVAYVAESQVGLSHARNRGAEECQEDWILYLDDDATVRANTIQQLLQRIRDVEQTLAAIGGRYEHHFRVPPPAWIKNMIGIGRAPDERMKKYGLLATESYLSGGVFCVRQSALMSIGSFRPRMGMQGKKMGYGEEDDVQDRLRKAGYTIAYDPEIVIDHLYHERKFSLSAQFSMRYAYGVANRRRDTVRHWFFGLFDYLFRQFPYHLGRWRIKHRNWPWQRVILELFGPLAYWWGTVPPVFKKDDKV